MYSLCEWIYPSDFEEISHLLLIFLGRVKLIHHQKFSFTKIWLLAAQFEIRQLNLKATLQILGNAIGKTSKDKVIY